jgi:hypothetical protein
MTPMLDTCIIPGAFVDQDDGYMKFMSMMAADNEVNNPVLLTVVGILLVDVKLRKQAAADERAENSAAPPVYDRFSFGAHLGVSSVVNAAIVRMAYLLARAAPGVPGDEAPPAPAGALVNTRYARTSRRWWLLYLLTKNPSLRRLRKAYIEMDIAAAATLDVSAAGAAATATPVFESDAFEALLVKPLLVKPPMGAAAAAAAVPQKSENPFADPHRQAHSDDGLDSEFALELL